MSGTSSKRFADVKSLISCGTLESTLKRHGYYCRSRRSGGIIKSPSCISCAKRKLRCDKTQPRCSRCKAKGVECHYIARPAKTIRKSAQITYEAATRSRSTGNKAPLTPSSLQNHIETSNNDTSSGDSALVKSTNLTGIDAESIDWNIPDFEFGDLLNSDFNDSVLEQPSSGWSLTDYTTSTSMIDQIQATSWPIPLQPTSNPRILVNRSNSRPGAQRATTLILHTLKSYLLTMLRNSALPPFIHPISTSAAFDMEPLDNCINLVHMISSGFKGSRNLFWRNVRIECERLRCEVG